MIVQMMVTPIGVIKVLRKKSALILPFVGASLALCLKYPLYENVTEKDPSDMDSTSSLAILGASLVFTILLFGLILITQIQNRWQRNFSTAPWTIVREEERIQANACPFYPPAQAMYYCTVCQGKVSSMAWHRPTCWIKIPFGDVMIDWDKAAEGVKMEKDPVAGRIMLDEALDFRGNVFLDEVEECCIGCYTLTRNFNCITRMAIICNLIALFSSLVPWAINGLDKSLQKETAIAVSVLASFYGASSVAVYVQAMASVICFLEDHKQVVTFPNYLGLPSWLVYLSRLLE